MPKYNEDGSIDLEYNHPQYGLIPFTASPDDIEALGRDLYQRALTGEFGVVEPFVPYVPTPEQLAQQAKSAIYALLDQTAQQYDYRNFAEVSQFLNSGVWKAEAEALLAWQDAVWLKAYALLKEPIESVEGFVAQLPGFVLMQNG